MALDYITGVMSAIYNKKLNSKIGYKGIIKKASYLLIIALSVILDRLLGQTGSVRTLVIYFFVANDGISILENVAEMNIPLPKKLKELLEQLKKEGDE
jgi:toxin secretion/phage lysis holin